MLTHQAAPTSDISTSILPPFHPDILEKPTSKADNLRMLLDLNGHSCEVVTGVTVVFPILQAPGYSVKCAAQITNTQTNRLDTISRSIDERTLVHFTESTPRILQAYVDSGEGLDVAGGFAAQVCRLPMSLIRPLRFLLGHGRHADTEIRWRLLERGRLPRSVFLQVLTVAHRRGRGFPYNRLNLYKLVCI